MSFGKNFSSALYRSIDQAKHSIASAIRMDVLPPTSASYGRTPIYSLTSARDVEQLATGSDADMGGASKMQLGLDSEEGKGRFYGTLSTEVPANAKLERSGYAAFRNRTRATLFGAQTWDATMHPYLRLRVRNRLAGPPSGEVSNNIAAKVRSAHTTPSIQRASAYTRAVHALGLDRANAPGPKYFVNIQTDGPVTSDLFQHRLLLDERKGNAWQDVIIPLTDFVLMNTGEVAPSQIGMMREKLRTIGVSVVLESPSLDNLKPAKTDNSRGSAPDALRSQTSSEEGENEGAPQVAKGSRRGLKYNFDLGIEHIEAISDDALIEEGITIEQH